MSIGRVSRKTMIGAVVAMGLATAFVLAAVLSAEVQRTQGIFIALDLVVKPDPFPDITIGVDPLVLSFFAEPLNNNPESLDVTVTISLLAVAGCALGTVTVDTVSLSGNAPIAQGDDLCTGLYTAPAQIIGTIAKARWSFEISYSATFVGQAVYTIQASGETI